MPLIVKTNPRRPTTAFGCVLGGRPFERKRLTGRQATRSELFVYRFEVDRDGIVRVWVPDSNTAYKAVRQYQMDVYVDDSRVTELIRKDQWE